MKIKLTTELINFFTLIAKLDKSDNSIDQLECKDNKLKVSIGDPTTCIYKASRTLDGLEDKDIFSLNHKYLAKVLKTCNDTSILNLKKTSMEVTTKKSKSKISYKNVEEHRSFLADSTQYKLLATIPKNKLIEVLNLTVDCKDYPIAFEANGEILKISGTNRYSFSHNKIEDVSATFLFHLSENPVRLLELLNGDVISISRFGNLIEFKTSTEGSVDSIIIVESAKTLRIDVNILAERVEKVKQNKIILMKEDLIDFYKRVPTVDKSLSQHSLYISIETKKNSLFLSTHNATDKATQEIILDKESTEHIFNINIECFKQLLRLKETQLNFYLVNDLLLLENTNGYTILISLQR